MQVTQFDFFSSSDDMVNEYDALFSLFRASNTFTFPMRLPAKICKNKLFSNRLLFQQKTKRKENRIMCECTVPRCDSQMKHM